MTRQTYSNGAFVPLPVFPYTNVYQGKLGFSTRLHQHTQADATAAAQRLAASGFSTIREDISWASSEPTTKGTFVWTLADLIMTACATAGLTWTPVIGATPNWAHGGGSDFYVPPTTDSDYADFVVAVLNRYGTGGAFWTANPSLTPKPITSVELWNEPFFGDTAAGTQGFFHATGANGPTWPTNGPDPVKYASMCVAAATAVRAAFPAVKIGISGEPYVSTPTPQSTQFLDAVLAAQPSLVSSGLFDAVAVHPYVSAKAFSPWDGATQGTGNATLIDPAGRFDRISKTQSVLVTRGATGKELWATEVGWTTALTTNGVAESAQEEYVRGACRRLIREFGVTRIYVFTFEDRMDSAPLSTDDTAGYNVLTCPGGNAPGTPKAVFTSLSRMAMTGDDGTEVYTSAVLADTPGLYLPLGVGGVVARDRSRNKLSGSQIGTVTGKQSGALSSETPDYSSLFDGTTGGFTVPHNNAFAVSSQVTVEAWAKVTATPTNAMILRKTGQFWFYAGSSGSGWVPNMNFSQSAATKAIFANSADAIPLNTWAYIVGVYDGANLLVYINGRLVKYAAQTGLIDSTGTSVVGIGYQGSAAAQYFPGYLERVAFYPYALSPQRIAEHYHAGVATPKP